VLSLPVLVAVATVAGEDSLLAKVSEFGVYAVSFFVEIRWCPNLPN
jgi:hypothetical protein